MLSLHLFEVPLFLFSISTSVSGFFYSCTSLDLFAPLLLFITSPPPFFTSSLHLFDCTASHLQPVNSYYHLLFLHISFSQFCLCVDTPHLLFSVPPLFPYFSRAAQVHYLYTCRVFSLLLSMISFVFFPSFTFSIHSVVV